MNVSVDRRPAVGRACGGAVGRQPGEHLVLCAMVARLAQRAGSAEQLRAVLGRMQQAVGALRRPVAPCRHRLRRSSAGRGHRGTAPGPGRPELALLGELAALRAREERLRELIEQAQDAIVSVDGAARVTRWNRAAEQLLGWTAEEALGRRLADLAIPCHLRDVFGHAFERLRAVDSLDDFPRRVPVAAIDRAGRPLAMELSLAATRVGGVWELTAFARDVSERRRLEQRLRELALSDALTGLANRRAFMDTLEKAISRAGRQAHGLALLFMDLDGFKQINDRLGHHAGDLVLQAFARRLVACVRRGDTVARLGGDEFTVLAEGVDSVAHARAIAHQLARALRAPIEEVGVRVGASVGVRLYRPPADAAQFLREADHAMYVAKNRHAAPLPEAMSAGGEALARGESR